MNILAVLRAVPLVVTAVKATVAAVAFVSTKLRPPSEETYRQAPLLHTKDRTKFTQHQCWYICDMRLRWETHNMNNPKCLISLARLVEELNDNLSLHKSRNSYARVWNRKIDRDALEVGTPVRKTGHTYAESE